MAHLYGDGIHDDTLAIQELIDSGLCEVSLPVPRKCYLISRPLELPSDFRLVLPRFAEIKLADGSNCVMLTNKSVPLEKNGDDIYSNGHNFDHNVDPLWHFRNVLSPDHPCRNIEVRGGIWNCNNRGQNENPIQTHVFEPVGYTGFGMFFYNITNFKLCDLTLKDPVNFAVTMDTISWFTVENIVFDFNYGNPSALNMDGIHLNGNCHYGTIRNIKGACYDDTVALNSDEGTCGPITNIDIDGIYATDSHSAIRMLSVVNPIENIHVRNIYGTYYQYCIGITKYYAGETTGYYAGIVLDNIHAAKAEMLPVYRKGPKHTLAPIYIAPELKIRDLTIRDSHRAEFNDPFPTITVAPHTTIDQLVLDNVSADSYIDQPIQLLVNGGTIRKLYTSRIRYCSDPAIVNIEEGTIETHIEQ